jgi:hypothetical protein
MDRNKAYLHEYSWQLCSQGQYPGHTGYPSYHRHKAKQPSKMRLWPLSQLPELLHSEPNGRRPSWGLPTKPNGYSYGSRRFQGPRALEKDEEALQGQQRLMDVRYSAKLRSIREPIRN